MNRSPSLAQFGTFDVENYGDLLYPVLLEKMLHRRGVTGELRKFSLRGGDPVQASGYTSRPILEFIRASTGESGSLIIGGGDILRTDSLRVASHYNSICARAAEPPIPFSWRRVLRRLGGKRETLEYLFFRRYLDYGTPGPFIVDPGKIPGLKAVAYCSVGVPFEFEEKSREQVATAMNKASFVHVRDRQSGKKLADAGVTREIHVAPDLAVMIGELFDAATERAKGRRLLEAQGVDIRRKILCVHSVVQTPERTAELIRELQERKARSQCEIVLLPLGFCHGDDTFLEQLAKDSQGAFHCVKRQSIFEMMSVIAASDLFLGTSLHGNITAFAFGIPHVIGPIPVDKCAGFLDVAGLPAELKAASWTQASVKLDMAAGLGGAFFRDRAVAARKRVNETVDLLVKAVG